MASQVLDRLYEVIERRRDERPAGSYVVTLLDAGMPAIAAKLREESEEVVRAAFDEDAHAVAHEAADVVFHLFVLLAARGIQPDAVYGELSRRFGIGGLAEKAARGAGDPGVGSGGEA
ncbi:MAG: phosphoribosyl-ATP diphosphatase [Deltaproteobacteria bacterium]|nr:phosphoribosyl-ATP diphosphatase [Deltaproteobacteria bacterium]